MRALGQLEVYAPTERFLVPTRWYHMSPWGRLTFMRSVRRMMSWGLRSAGGFLAAFLPPMGAKLCPSSVASVLLKVACEMVSSSTGHEARTLAARRAPGCCRLFSPKESPTISVSRDWGPT